MQRSPTEGRREFLKELAGSVLACTSEAGWGAERDPELTPCINQVCTIKADFRTAMDAYGKAGFRQVELWLDSVEPFLVNHSVAMARRVMSDCGLEPRAACYECNNLFLPRLLESSQEKWDGFKRKLERSAQLGAQRFVLCSAIFEEVRAEDYDTAIEGLERVGELARAFGIVVALEFIRRAHFLGSVETTANLLRRVNHANVKVLIDTFHFYAGASKLSDIDALKIGEIGWTHINDAPASVPRELLDDMDRVYVGEGNMPLPQILRAINRTYSGPVSVELLQYADRDPYEVAKKAYGGISRLLNSL